MFDHAGEPALIPAARRRHRGDRGDHPGDAAPRSAARSQLAGYAGHLLRVPRPMVKGMQQVIDSGTVGKVDVKAERLVDMSLADELEKSGFIDSVYKE